MSAILQAHLHSANAPQGARWNKPPLYRYKQIWYQLTVIDGILYCQYTPTPMQQAVTVPILPPSLHKDALSCNHDAPTASHLGADKTLERLRHDGF